MNKRIALKATLALAIMISVGIGLGFMLVNYTKIAGYVSIGLFLSIMWMMIYNVVEKLDSDDKK